MLLSTIKQRSWINLPLSRTVSLIKRVMHLLSSSGNICKCTENSHLSHKALLFQHFPKLEDRAKILFETKKACEELMVLCVVGNLPSWSSGLGWCWQYYMLQPWETSLNVSQGTNPKCHTSPQRGPSCLQMVHSPQKTWFRIITSVSEVLMTFLSTSAFKWNSSCFCILQLYCKGHNL